MATYTASNAVIANPERGFFQYSESHYYQDNNGHVPLNVTTMTNARTGSTNINNITFQNMSVVFKYFYMEKYRTIATIEQAYLNLVAADLAAVRNAGCKVILRFAYYANQNSDDAAPSIVRGHIAQLAPVVNQYADIVDSVEAGMIGAWGEWYYTNNFGDQGNLTSQNISDRNSVIDAWLNNLDSRIFVLLRYMGSRQTYLNSTNPNPGGNAVRLGHHNDAFTATYANYGTYTTFSSQSESFNRSYLAAINNIPVGGESASYNSPDSDFPNASSELAAYHWSFLNPNYFQQTIGSWGQSGCDTASQKLGYRLRMVSSNIPSTMAAGSSNTVQVVVTNDGYGAPTRNRPVQLVFDDGAGHVTTTAFPTDTRTWTPGTQVTLSMNVTAPSSGGTYNTYLVLPDPSGTIANNPVYNIQMANANTWDAGTGRNSLASPVTVGGSSSSPSATLSNVSTSITQGSNATATLSLSNIATAYVVLYTGASEQGSRTSSSGGSISLTPASSGSYTIRVYTAASGGTLLTESPTITVSAQSSASASFNSVSTSVTLGNPVTGNVVFTNISSGYITLVTGGTEQGRVNLNTGGFSITPSTAGTYTVRAYAGASGGSILAETGAITVSSSASASASITVASTNVTQGNPITGTLSLTNASTGYLVLYTGGAEVSGGRTASAAGSYSLTPASAGTYTVRVYSANTGGTLLAESSAVTVAASGSASASFNGVSTNVTLGNPVTGNVIFTNISSGYITLATGGNESSPRVSLNTGGFAITPNSTGSYTVRAYSVATGGTMLAESPAVTVSSSGTVSASLSNVSANITLGASVTGTLSLSNASNAYVVLYNGAEQGSRVQTAGGSLPTLTPSSAGSYTVRVYTAASGGTLLTESPTITVSAAQSGGSGIKKVFKVTVNGTTKIVKLV